MSSLCNNFINRPIGSYRPLRCRPIVVTTRELRGTGLANKQDLFFLTKPNTIREHATLDLLYPAPFYVVNEVNSKKSQTALKSFIGTPWNVNQPTDLSKTVDGNFNTKTENFKMTNVNFPDFGSLIYDFGSIKTRKARIKWEFKSTGSLVFTLVRISNDAVDATSTELESVFTTGQLNSNDFTTPLLQFRYLHLTGGSLNTDTVTVNIFEAADVT